MSSDEVLLALSLAGLAAFGLGYLVGKADRAGPEVTERQCPRCGSEMYRDYRPSDHLAWWKCSATHCYHQHAYLLEPLV